MTKKVADKRATATLAPEPEAEPRRSAWLRANPYVWGLAMIDDPTRAALDAEDREAGLQAETDRLVTRIVEAVATAGDLRALAVATKPDAERKPRAPITDFVSYRDVMAALDCKRSTAYRHLREAAGRKAGTHKLLRVPVQVWERYQRRVFPQ